MSLYLKQIEQLVALQRIDSEIIVLKAELEAAPKEVQELEAQFAEMDSRRTQMAEKIDYLKEQESRLSKEIEEDTLKIKKSKNKLMMVNNTKEYHAMMREMDNLEKMNRLKEEERVTLSEELQRQKTDQQDVTTEISELEGVLKEKRTNLDARIKEAESRLAKLDRQRKTAGKNVPAPVLGRYEFIRSRLAAPVIVPVTAGVCAGCNIAIPPQGFIELQKGEQILSCPNCQRLIYWSEHFTPPEEQKKKDEAAEAEKEKKPKKAAPKKAAAKKKTTKKAEKEATAKST